MFTIEGKEGGFKGHFSFYFLEGGVVVDKRIVAEREGRRTYSVFSFFPLVVPSIGSVAQEE